MAQMISTVRNGVDTQQLFGTLDAIGTEPGLGAFTFRATNRWINGTHNRSRIQGFFGAGREDDSRREAFVIDAGEPTVLLGTDSGPNAAEYLLHALASCLTTTIVFSAAARKIRLTEIESSLETDMHLQDGFGAIRVTVRLAGEAAGERLRALVDQAQQRSPMLKLLSRSVPVTVDAVIE